MKKHLFTLVLSLTLITGCNANQGLPVAESKTPNCQVEIVEPNGFATQNEITLGDKWWVTLGDITNTCSDVLTLNDVQLDSVRIPSDVTFLETALVVEDPKDFATDPMLWAWLFDDSEEITPLSDFQIKAGQTVGVAVLVELSPSGGQQDLSTLTSPDFVVNAVSESGEAFTLTAPHTVTFSTESTKL